VEPNQIKNPLSEWRGSAQYWAKNAGVVRSMFAPITTALFEAAQLREAESVLDIAGGSGEPSLTVAETLDPSRLVLYTDAIAEMVAAARKQSRDRRLTNIEFAQCTGESLPFARDRFDAVICRLGIMLFTDPEAAAREMLRVVKPARAAACAVWHNRESNPFFHVVADVLSRYVDSPAEDPDEPGAFRFAERGKLANVFAESGAVEVSETLLDFILEAQLTPRQFWELRVELSDTLRGKVAGLSATELRALADEVEEASLQFLSGELMRFPAQVLIVRAQKG